MKVLVFGGLGFMGANFVNWTLRNRPEVEIQIADAFTYAADPGRLQSPERVEIYHANLLSPSEYKGCLDWCDLVLNFAAETHNDNSLERPIDFYQSNLLGLVNLMHACLGSKKPLLHISTDEVYGDFPLDSEELATEEYPFRPSSPYSASKAAGDLAVMAWVRSFGLSAMVTHCTNNYGPGQNEEKFLPSVLRAISSGTPIRVYGNGLNIRDWVHVDDHSSALWTLIEKGSLGNRYNISGGNHRTNLQLIEELLSALGMNDHPLQFVKDRPGHDLRYGLDSSKLRLLGWQAREGLDFRFLSMDLP